MKMQKISMSLKSRMSKKKDKDGGINSFLENQSYILSTPDLTILLLIEKASLAVFEPNFLSKSFPGVSTTPMSFKIFLTITSESILKLLKSK